VPTATISPRRLRAAREAAGFSREQVCVLIGRGWRSVYSYENGTQTPSAHVLVGLAELYGVPVDTLLDSVEASS
jgi:transcriptional regulator with XRE-family HTH domain